MSLANQGFDPLPARDSHGGVALPPSAEKIQAKFDLSITLALAAWPALTLAVQNSWGGPDSPEKRDWFAGAISDLIEATPVADVEYVEEFMLQIMNDEFDVNVEDGSAEEIAAKIVGLRKLTLLGDFEMVDQMYQKWQERNARGGGQAKIQHVQRAENEDDTDWDSVDMEDDSDEDVEMEMDQAPGVIKAQKEKVQPKVDDEGFTEVSRRRKR